MLTVQTRVPDTAVVTPISLREYRELWQQHHQLWQRSGPFVSPAWLTAWWECFGGGAELLLLTVANNGQLLGVAPLMVEDRTARLIGSEDVSDYLDFLVLEGTGQQFFTILVSHLRQLGIRKLCAIPVRPESSVLKILVPWARKAGYMVELEDRNVSVQMRLPASWNEYLAMLSKKQRHEAERKMRRLAETGVVSVRRIGRPEEVAAAMAHFFHWFRLSREDKEIYMTPGRERFFLTLAWQLTDAGMLNMLALEIDGAVEAMVFCIELGSTTYLYNNGFNPEFRSASIGIVSKLMTIRDSIADGKSCYDFLNGTEEYKYRLGGTEIPLTACTIGLDCHESRH
jgi:CelD/BcsL family acetyltransferase involved in cellulose biosynthesis